MSEHLPDFAELFVPIQLCLVKGTQATGEDFVHAIDSYNTLIAVIFNPQQASSPCLDGIPKFIPIRIKA